MTSRSEFLGRVRSSLDGPDGSNAVGGPPAVDDRLLRLMALDEDIATLFATRAAGTGMIVHRCTPDGLADTVRQVLGSLGTGRIVLDHIDSSLAHQLGAALARCGEPVIDPRSARSLDPQFDAGVGITGVFAAIAETGTLVLTSDATHSRGAFLIPPVHVALVHEAQVIPDMLDLWPFLGSRPPTAVTLVTGPSKTADIEGVLVTGVHGPGAVHVILIASNTSASQESAPPRYPIQGDVP